MIWNILFGLAVFVGFFSGGFILWQAAKSEHISESDVFDVYLVSSLWALVGARAVAVALHFSEFGPHFLRWLSVFSIPGLDGRGALALGGFMVWVGIVRRKWDMWLALDFFSRGILLFSAFVLLPLWWIVSVFWFIWLLFLQYVEREYRVWDWYRVRRASARPGLVFGLGLVGLGIGFWILAALRLDVVFSTVFGTVLLVSGLVVSYARSERHVGRDIKSFFGNIGAAVGIKRKK